MKKYLVFSFFLLACTSVTGQTSALEARAAYLLAEESYGKGDMHSTLQYLNDAVAKLGAPNAKILYLKVMSLKELTNKDTRYGSKLDAAVADFEKAPDIADFNEEKSLEVIKIKMERNKEKNRGATMQKGFEDLQKEFNCYIGMGIDSVIDLNKEAFKDYFKENGEYFIMRDYKSGRKTITKKERVAASSYSLVTDANNQAKKTIVWKDNRLTAFSYFYYNHKFGEETPDFSLSRREFAPILEKFNALFGYLPEPVLTSTSGVTTTQYIWRLAGLSAYLTIVHQSATGLGSTSYCAIGLSKI